MSNSNRLPLHTLYKSLFVFLLVFSTFSSAQNITHLEKGGIEIDGLLTIKFPTPGEIGSYYLEECNIQTIDSVGFPVMCQQFGAGVLDQGKEVIQGMGLNSILASALDPFGLFNSNGSLKTRIAKGTGLMIAGISIMATCPPIPVDEGFHDLNLIEKAQQAQAFGYIPSAPSNLDFDVDDVLDPLSCTATLDIEINPSNNEVTNFGDFTGREFAYVAPFGSYPVAVKDLAFLAAEFTACAASLSSLVEISVGSGLSLGFNNVPQLVDIDLDDIMPGLLDLVLDNIGLDDFELVARNNFNSWKNTYKQNNPHYCSNATCEFEHGLNRMTFFENMPASSWGNVTPSVEYYQDVHVMEYFDPVITALPLTVHLEALEIGGVTVNAYPPRSFTGTPPAQRNYTFDESWLGITDNCEANPTVVFDVQNFYPLGNWDIPITVTDRVGNVTNNTMRIVVEDTIPPDLLPLDAVGIPVEDGETVIKFTDSGIGCVLYLCEENDSDPYLFPPTYFDFASITPDVQCVVENVLEDLTSCSSAQLPVNDVSLITWNIADPSGNVTEITQQVFVRESSFNQIPTVNDLSYIIGQNTQVQIPLSGNDENYDPLHFSAVEQPLNGNLDGDIEAIFQTRFTTSGMIRNASGMIMFTNQSGPNGLLLSVPDEKRMYLYKGDLTSAAGEVINRYPLSVITPSAITFSDTKYKTVSSGNLYQVLETAEDPIWIGDWVNRKVYRYTYNIATDTAVEKEIFTLPSGIEQPSGLVVENVGTNQYQVIIADKQDNELWRSSVTRTVNNSDLNSQNYGLNYSEVASNNLPFAVDAMDNWNSNNLLSDYGEVIITSWETKQLVWFDWDDGISESWDISDLVDDLDGPEQPGLPVLQKPIDIVLVSDGAVDMKVALFDQTELKYTQKEFVKSTHTVRCGGSQGSTTLTCLDPENDVLRLPALVDILAIEEFNSQIVVLDNNPDGHQHLYRFDLSGRLDAIISLYSSASTPSPLPTSSQTSYIDLALMDNGDVLLLEKGDNNSTANIRNLTVSSGVDNYFLNDTISVARTASETTKAIDVNASDIVLVTEAGVMRIPLSNTGNQSLIITASTFIDISLSDSNEIYVSHGFQTPVNHINRYSISGTILNSIGFSELDYNNQTEYGRVFFDSSLNQVWISDFANIFYPNLGVSGETHRMPRVTAYSPDGALLEQLIPDGDPNDFFSFLEPGDFGTITSMAVGPDRFYVAESAPLKRLHVFDTSAFIPVICNNLPEGEVCREVGYLPTNGFLGTDSFNYVASDPFNAASEAATVTITVINDQQAPILTCPASIELEKNHASGFVADLTLPEQEPNSIMRGFLMSILVSENTDLPEVEASHNIPAALPLGTTTITYAATDGSNNTGTCQTDITIVDTTAPTMEATATLIVEATALLTPRNDIFLPAPATVDFSAYLVTHDGPLTFPIGETPITWTASDHLGNISQQQQLIIVKDTTPPEFTSAAISNDLFGSTIEIAIAYTEPQAIDTVGINNAGMVCLPAIGDMVPMGPTLVQCNISDNYGNKSSSSFVVNYYDNDTNSDGIIDVLDLGNSQFSDQANSGQTNGEITAFGNYSLKVYEAPTGEGISIGLKTSLPNKAAAPASLTACNDQIIMNNLNNETILFDDISVEVFDHVAINCLNSGYKIFSLLGNNDFTLKLPDNSIATVTLPFNNGLIIDGYTASLLERNRGNITIHTNTESYTLSPGSTADLSVSNTIFSNSFE